MLVLLDTNSIYRDPFLREQAFLRALAVAGRVSVAIPDVALMELALQAEESAGRYNRFLDLHGRDLARFELGIEMPVPPTDDSVAFQAIYDRLRQACQDASLNVLPVSIDAAALLRTSRYGERPFTVQNSVVRRDAIGHKERPKNFVHGFGDAAIWQCVLNALETDDVLFVSRNTKDFGETADARGQSRGSIHREWMPGDDFFDPTTRSHALRCVTSVRALRSVMQADFPEIITQAPARPSIPSAPGSTAGAAVPLASLTPQLAISRVWDLVDGPLDADIFAMVEAELRDSSITVDVSSWPDSGDLELEDIVVSQIGPDGSLEVKDVWSLTDGAWQAELHLPVWAIADAYATTESMDFSEDGPELPEGVHLARPTYRDFETTLDVEIEQDGTLAIVADLVESDAEGLELTGVSFESLTR